MRPAVSAAAIPLEDDFFRREVVTVARALIGVRLLVDGVGGVIVETEAYHRSDPASHAFPGPTPRNSVMFGPPGRAYVYQSYGPTLVLELYLRAGTGSGRSNSSARTDRRASRHGGPSENRRPSPIVFRAGEALSGAERYATSAQWLAPRPATLRARAVLVPGDKEIATGVRIGLSKGIDTPWRFGLLGSPFLSRRF